MKQSENLRHVEFAPPPGQPSEEPPRPEDSRMLEAMEDYLAGQQAGCKVGREEFLAKYPEIASALADCLDGLDFIQTAAPSLHQSVQDSPNTAAGELQPEGPLGDYRIVREVGRGGMGVVYEAVQISLGRRVALKVLPFAATMDPKQLQRFKYEAQAAAHLHHTNIVPVFGVGCERGVHYYAMQFIEGQTLANMIADLHSPGTDAARTGDRRVQATTPPATGAYQPASPVPQSPGFNRPSAPTHPIAALSTERSITSAAHFRTVANLGVQAAEALEHAHDHGVIHRDIKPANLLLDARANLWITDFGLAHCQSQTGLTMSGDLVGTLRYMSPEQALAKRVLIDHRTDVYSLGATLYELLTLQPVFTGGDRQELLRQIAFEEPRSPRRVNRPIPAELETIVLKALEKNPAERYATAQELADDLRRFLEDKPIRAKRPTLVQRAAKWSRRHRSVVWCTALIVLILSSSLGWIVRDREARRTEAEGRVAEALAVAEAKLREGNPHDPELVSAARKAEAHLASGVVREEAKRQVEQVLADLAMLAKLEEIRLVPAEVKEDRSEFGAADRAYALAFREYGIDIEALGAEEAAARIRQRPIGLHLAVALDDWARARMRLGQINAKQPPQDPRWQQLLQIAQSADPDPWRVSLREALAKGQQGSDDLKKLLASAPIATLAPTTLDLFGRALRDAGAAPAAAEMLRQAQRLYPSDFWINQNLGFLLADMNPPQFEQAIGFYRAALALRPKSAMLYFNLGHILKDQRKLPEAEDAFRKAAELNPDDARAYHNLGTVLSVQHKLSDAAAALHKAIELRPDDALPYNGLGNVLKDQKKLREAVTAYRKAIELMPHFAMAYYNLGNALYLQKKLPEAIAAYRKAIEFQPDYVDAYVNIGGVFLEQRKAPEAEVPLRKAIELKPDYAEAYNNLGEALGMQQKASEAEAAFRKAITLKPDFVLAYTNLGAHLLDEQKKLPEAEKSARQALAMFEKFVADFPSEPEGRYNLVLTHQRLAGMFPEAPTEREKHYRQSIAIGEKLAHDFPNEPRYRSLLIPTYGNFGLLLQDMGRPAEAEAHFERGASICEKLIAEVPGQPLYREGWAMMLANLGMVRRETPRYDEADKVLRQAQAILEKLVKELPKNSTYPHVLANVLRHRAVLCRDREELAEARRLLGDAIAREKTALELSGNASPFFAGRAGIFSLMLADTLLRMPQDPALTGQIEALVREAVRSSADDHNAQNALACFLATCPEPRFADPKHALELAKKLVEQAPYTPDHWRTLGAARYETGDWQGAVAALKKAVELSNGGNGTERFFLSMASWRMGNQEQARASYEQAAEWLAKHNPQRYELRRWRAQAAALLGIHEQPPTKKSPLNQQQ